MELQKLYEPVTFVYTETIGGETQKTHTSPYIWKFTDILIPKPLTNDYLHLYYIFHVPPIYNWLKNIDNYCYEIEQLKKYIASPVNINNKSQNRNLQAIKNKLKNYSKKWEIVKLCLNNKVFIQSAYKCKHMLKTEQSTSSFTYDFKRQDFTSNRVFCKECGTIVEVNAEIRQWAYAPVFDRYYGNQIATKNGKYELMLMISNETVHVKASNRLLYLMRGKNNQMSMKVSSQSFQKSDNSIFCYLHESAWQNCGILKFAEQIRQKVIRNEIIKTMQIQQSRQKEQDNFQEQQTKKSKRQDMLKIKKLVALKKEINPVLLSEQQKNKQKYKETIDKLFYKPKEKDEYQKEYDKGKTKKIKKKVEYIKPDFNDLFRKLKDGTLTEQQGEEDNSKFRRDRKMRQGGRPGFDRKNHQKFGDKKWGKNDHNKKHSHKNQKWSDKNKNFKKRPQ